MYHPIIFCTVDFLIWLVGYTYTQRIHARLPAINDTPILINFIKVVNTTISSMHIVCLTHATQKHVMKDITIALHTTTCITQYSPMTSIWWYYYHALFLRHDLEERVMPLQDVYLQQSV